MLKTRRKHHKSKDNNFLRRRYTPNVFLNSQKKIVSLEKTFLENVFLPPPKIAQNDQIAPKLHKMAGNGLIAPKSAKMLQNR